MVNTTLSRGIEDARPCCQVFSKMSCSYFVRSFFSQAPSLFLERELHPFHLFLCSFYLYFTDLLYSVVSGKFRHQRFAELAGS